MLGDHGIHSMEELRAVLKPGQLDILQTGKDTILPWYAIVLGYPVLGIYYWCADQTIVQKVLGAKSMSDAQNGPTLCRLPENSACIYHGISRASWPMHCSPRSLQIPTIP